MKTGPSYAITSQDAFVGIEITDVGHDPAELIEAFAECQQGRCTCPTDEYRKVEAMEVRPAENRIVIRLEARPGIRLDPWEIATCLDHVVASAEE